MVILRTFLFLKMIKNLNFVLPYSFDNTGNLLDLVLRGELDEAKRLIENGADVRAEDQHGKKKKKKKNHKIISAHDHEVNYSVTY